MPIEEQGATSLNPWLDEEFRSSGFKTPEADLPIDDVAERTGVQAEVESVLAAGKKTQYYRGDKSWQSLDQAAVAGLTAGDGPTFDHVHITNQPIIGNLPIFCYNAILADDAYIELPSRNNACGAFGFAQCKDENYAVFYVRAKGTVVLLHEDNAVANADTDARLCIGTAAAQNPLRIKNRCGSARILTVVFWYVP